MVITTIRKHYKNYYYSNYNEYTDNNKIKIKIIITITINHCKNNKNENRNTVTDNNT